MAVIALAQGWFFKCTRCVYEKNFSQVENESVISLSQDLKSNIKALAE